MVPFKTKKPIVKKKQKQKQKKTEEKDARIDLINRFEYLRILNFEKTFVKSDYSKNKDNQFWKLVYPDISRDAVKNIYHDDLSFLKMARPEEESEELKNLKKEIASINELIKNNKKEKKIPDKQIKILTNQIESIQEIIEIIEGQNRFTSRSFANLGILQLKENLAILGTNIFNSDHKFVDEEKYKIEISVFLDDAVNNRLFVPEELPTEEGREIKPDEEQQLGLFTKTPILKYDRLFRLTGTVLETLSIHNNVGSSDDRIFKYEKKNPLAKNASTNDPLYLFRIIGNLDDEYEISKDLISPAETKEDISTINLAYGYLTVSTNCTTVRTMNDNNEYEYSIKRLENPKERNPLFFMNHKPEFDVSLEKPELNLIYLIYENRTILESEQFPINLRIMDASKAFEYLFKLTKIQKNINDFIIFEKKKQIQLPEQWETSFANCRMNIKTGEVYALRDIKAGEELTFDYGQLWWDTFPVPKVMNMSNQQKSIKNPFWIVEDENLYDFLSALNELSKGGTKSQKLEKRVQDIFERLNRKMKIDLYLSNFNTISNVVNFSEFNNLVDFFQKVIAGSALTNGAYFSDYTIRKRKPAVTNLDTYHKIRYKNIKKERHQLFDISSTAVESKKKVKGGKKEAEQEEEPEEEEQVEESEEEQEHQEESEEELEEEEQEQIKEGKQEIGEEEEKGKKKEGQLAKKFAKELKEFSIAVGYDKEEEQKILQHFSNIILQKVIATSSVGLEYEKGEAYRDIDLIKNQTAIHINKWKKQNEFIEGLITKEDVKEIQEMTKVTTKKSEEIKTAITILLPDTVQLKEQQKTLISFLVNLNEILLTEESTQDINLKNSIDIIKEIGSSLCDNTDLFYTKLDYSNVTSRLRFADSNYISHKSLISLYIKRVNIIYKLNSDKSNTEATLISEKNEKFIKILSSDYTYAAPKDKIDESLGFFGNLIIGVEDPTQELEEKDVLYTLYMISQNKNKLERSDEALRGAKSLIKELNEILNSLDNIELGIGEPRLNVQLSHDLKLDILPNLFEAIILLYPMENVIKELDRLGKIVDQILQDNSKIQLKGKYQGVSLKAAVGDTAINLYKNNLQTFKKRCEHIYRELVSILKVYLESMKTIQFFDVHKYREMLYKLALETPRNRVALRKDVAVEDFIDEDDYAEYINKDEMVFLWETHETTYEELVFDKSLTIDYSSFSIRDIGKWVYYQNLLFIDVAHKMKETLKTLRNKQQTSSHKTEISSGYQNIMKKSTDKNKTEKQIHQLISAAIFRTIFNNKVILMSQETKVLNDVIKPEERSGTNDHIPNVHIYDNIKTYMNPYDIRILSHYLHTYVQHEVGFRREFTELILSVVDVFDSITDIIVKGKQKDEVTRIKDSLLNSGILDLVDIAALSFNLQDEKGATKLQYILAKSRNIVNWYNNGKQQKMGERGHLPFFNDTLNLIKNVKIKLIEYLKDKGLLNEEGKVAISDKFTKELLIESMQSIEEIEKEISEVIPKKLPNDETIFYEELSKFIAENRKYIKVEDDERIIHIALDLDKFSSDVLSGITNALNNNESILDHIAKSFEKFFDGPAFDDNILLEMFFITFSVVVHFEENISKIHLGYVFSELNELLNSQELTIEVPEGFKEFVRNAAIENENSDGNSIWKKPIGDSVFSEQLARLIYDKCISDYSYTIFSEDHQKKKIAARRGILYPKKETEEQEDVEIFALSSYELSDLTENDNIMFDKLNYREQTENLNVGVKEAKERGEIKDEGMMEKTLKGESTSGSKLKKGKKEAKTKTTKQKLKPKKIGDSFPQLEREQVEQRELKRATEVYDYFPRNHSCLITDIIFSSVLNESYVFKFGKDIERSAFYIDNGLRASQDIPPLTTLFYVGGLILNLTDFFFSKIDEETKKIRSNYENILKNETLLIIDPLVNRYRNTNFELSEEELGVIGYIRSSLLISPYYKTETVNSFIDNSEGSIVLREDHHNLLQEVYHKPDINRFSIVLPNEWTSDFASCCISRENNRLILKNYRTLKKQQEITIDFGAKHWVWYAGFVDDKFRPKWFPESSSLKRSVNILINNDYSIETCFDLLKPIELDGTEKDKEWWSSFSSNLKSISGYYKIVLENLDKEEETGELDIF